MRNAHSGYTSKGRTQAAQLNCANQLSNRGCRRRVASEVRIGRLSEMCPPVVQLHRVRLREVWQVLQRSLPPGRGQDRAALRLPASGVSIAQVAVERWQR